MGTERKDHRWLSADGQEWDSRFEAQVYEGIHKSGQAKVERTTKGKPGESDTLLYTVPVRDATCSACGASQVSKRRNYTPDLRLPDAPARDNGVFSHTGFYVEVKGYLRANERSLLRAFCKARPDIDLRFVFQRDFRIGAGTAISWVTKFLKRPACVWTGRLPDEWLVSKND